MLKMKNKNGFNLIELLVSISIMSILLTISVPSFSSWLNNLRVETIIKTYNLAILQARTEAIKTNKLVRLNLNSDTTWEILNEKAEVINRKNSEITYSGIDISFNPSWGYAITFNGNGEVVSNQEAGLGGDFINAIEVVGKSYFTNPKKIRLKIGAGGATLICNIDETDIKSDYYCRDI